LNKVQDCLDWLHHYEEEFNESPHLAVGRLIKMLQQYSKAYSYNWSGN